MSQSTIALLILLAALILYATEKLPICVTAILSMLVMGFTGILTFSEAFSGMGNPAVLLIVGTSILGQAFFSTGLSDRLCDWLLRNDQMSQWKFTLLMIACGALMTTFFNAMVVLAIFMPIIDCLEQRTNGAISRKQAYFPLAVASEYGGNKTNIGSTSIMTAASIYAAAEGQRMSFFAPLPLALPGLVTLIVIYLTFGTQMQENCFDFTPTPLPEMGAVVSVSPEMRRRQPIVLLAMLGSMVGFISGLDMGAVALSAAMLVLVTGCIDVKTAFRGVSWETVFAVVGSLGFAKGVAESGAGQRITDIVLKLCGPIGHSTVGMAIVMLILGSVLSNFMSNNATVAILTPIAISIASTLGASPLFFTLVCGVASNLVCATPICTASITITASCGYRFKDYVRVGGVINFLAVLATAAMICVLLGTGCYS